jgi:hypothetical protein
MCRDTMRYIAMLSFLVLLLSASCNRCEQTNDLSFLYPPPDSGACLEDLTYHIHKYVAEKYDENVDLHVTYAAITYDDVTGRYGFWADFYSQEILDVCAARHFIVDLIEGILGNINRYSEYVRSGQVVLEPSDIYVNVKFSSFYGVYVDPLYVGRTELKDGYITGYYAHTALNPDSIIFHIHFEPYVRSLLLRNIDNQIEEERQVKIEREKALEKSKEPVFHLKRQQAPIRQKVAPAPARGPEGKGAAHPKSQFPTTGSGYGSGSGSIPTPSTFQQSPPKP